MLEQAEESARHAREVEQGYEGRLRIGLVSSMLYRGLPDLLREFQVRHPQLRVMLRELNSHDQMMDVLQGRLDVGFVHTMRVPAEISRLLVASEPFLCCVPSGHPLAKARRLKLRRLQEEAFVMFSRDASPDYYERVLAICSDAGFYPEVRHEVRHWLSVVSMVAQGLGVALVPAALKVSGIPGAAFVPLEASTARSEAFCVWRSADDNAGLQSFLGAVRAAVPPAARAAAA
jgi:DNA-binding transcriptional LysR family regulator